MDGELFPAAAVNCLVTVSVAEHCVQSQKHPPPARAPGDLGSAGISRLKMRPSRSSRNGVEQTRFRPVESWKIRCYSDATYSAICSGRAGDCGEGPPEGIPDARKPWMTEIPGHGEVVWNEECLTAGAEALLVLEREDVVAQAIFVAESAN